MSNGLAWILLLGGVAVVIIGIRGSQHALFPWLPNLGASSGGNTPAANLVNQQLQGVKCSTPPDANGNCPPGRVLIGIAGSNGCCVQVSY